MTIKGYISDSIVYTIVKKTYPNMDMRKQPNQLRAIYYSILRKAKKERGL